MSLAEDLNQWNPMLSFQTKVIRPHLHLSCQQCALLLNLVFIHVKGFVLA